MSGEIVIHGARLHNLKNITVRIPKNTLVAITGVSGSGKSALALDVLNREGQRQYWEALGWVAYQMGRPPVDRIEGLTPTVAVDQRPVNRSPRSTVGTETEIYTFLRVLFARVGRRPCPACGREIPPPYVGTDGAERGGGAAEIRLAGGEEEVERLPVGEAVAVLDEEGETDGGAAAGETFPCPHCGAPVPVLTMGHFSFNKPSGACPTCTGLGTVDQVDVDRLVDFTKSLLDGAVEGWSEAYARYQAGVLQRAAAYYGLDLDVSRPIAEYGPAQRDLLLYGVGSPQFRRHFRDVAPPETVKAGRFEGVATGFMRRYAARIADAKYREKMERFILRRPCPDCGGTRLRAESRAVTVAGRSIVDLARIPLTDLASWVESLREAAERGDLGPGARDCVLPIAAGLQERLRRVLQVGVGYLTLDRPMPTLSGGEAQRLRLAALLGSELSGVTYVLDEPTTGLHPRDTAALVAILRELRDRGNTVVVIEHDLDVIRAADHVIDLGPGAGRDGGRVVAAGTPAEVARAAGSATGRFLSGAEVLRAPARRRPGNGAFLTIRGARAHNLKDITVRLPLGMLVAVTGVSGSGKTTLLFDILERAARRRFYGAGGPPGEHDAIEGWEHLDRVVAVDQAPLPRVPRSNAATYTEAWGAIRKLYAGLPYSREHGLTEGHFSFNVPGGRCERCEGAGVVSVHMHFLPPVEVRCPACRGRRFRPEVLAARYRGFSIADVLEMTIAEAADLFRDVAPIHNRLSLMVECGLGYLTLGQPASTFSGGEAQRIKLARELGRKARGRALYLLDEPSRGLHPADVANLLRVLHGRVDPGHTVAVVEHNPDVIRAADWVIDLGPEGGREGGWLVAEGTPEQVARVEGSHTGRVLRALL